MVFRVVFRYVLYIGGKDKGWLMIMWSFSHKNRFWKKRKVDKIIMKCWAAASGDNADPESLRFSSVRRIINQEMFLGAVFARELVRQRQREKLTNFQMQTNTINPTNILILSYVIIHADVNLSHWILIRILLIYERKGSCSSCWSSKDSCRRRFGWLRKFSWVSRSIDKKLQPSNDKI